MINLPARYTYNGKSESGGVGQIIFCTDNNLEREVAIKIIKDPAHLDRMKDEIQALLAMRSKHVVQVYDLIYFENGEAGLVLEYIDGKNLFDSVEHKANLKTYLKTLWQIASGIADIHGSGIIHRDIKPNNMKLDSEGIVKIFDFGLSREEDINAETMGFKGTFGFAAPELYSHSKVAFTKAIDVFAFGSTALYLLIDDLPVELKTPGPPSPVKDDVFDPLLSECPELTKLLLKCLEQNPDLRPDINEISDLLETYLTRGMHQALTVINGNTHILNSNARKIKVAALEIASLSIIYDDFKFIVDEIQGDVYVNNIKLTNGKELTGSCVITMGAPVLGWNRSYVTFDISNPEVSI